MKALRTPSKQRRISRWAHKEVLEAVQQRLDENPQAMSVIIKCLGFSTIE